MSAVLIPLTMPTVDVIRAILLHPAERHCREPERVGGRRRRPPSQAGNAMSYLPRPGAEGPAPAIRGVRLERDSGRDVADDRLTWPRGRRGCGRFRRG